MSDEVSVDPPRLHEAATTVGGASDTMGGLKPGAFAATAGGLPGSSVSAACVSGSQMAAAAFTALSQTMSGWSATAHANADTFVYTDSTNREQVQASGAGIPGQD